jgi:hypothetical protein
MEEKYGRLISAMMLWGAIILLLIAPKLSAAYPGYSESIAMAVLIAREYVKRRWVLPDTTTVVEVDEEAIAGIIAKEAGKVTMEYLESEGLNIDTTTTTEAADETA